MSDRVPTRKKKRSSPPPGSTPASRVAVLLEDIGGKVQATMEAVSGFRTEFRSEIGALRVELSRRIEVLELAVRQNSADIRQNSEDIRQNTGDIRQNSADIRQNSEDIRRNTGDIRRNTEEIHGLRELLERKADRETLMKLEARVQIVEQRLGIP
jgi:chromosome segregation ATPase